MLVATPTEASDSSGLNPTWEQIKIVIWWQSVPKMIQLYIKDTEKEKVWIERGLGMAQKLHPDERQALSSHPRSSLLQRVILSHLKIRCAQPDWTCWKECVFNLAHAAPPVSLISLLFSFFVCLKASCVSHLINSALEQPAKRWDQ